MRMRDGESSVIWRIVPNTAGWGGLAITTLGEATEISQWAGLGGEISHAFSLLTARAWVRVRAYAVGLGDTVLYTSHP